eukprot:GILJ01009685.1.p1 GENE.GILJ01009685.1~~GILJ01009685.1.p1  ORF type:complete len:113 (-),score=5.74 GILJ01009685.1:138-446(-)
MKSQVFDSFDAFYPYYLQEHKNRINRRLHIIGTSFVVMLLAYSLLTRTFGTLMYLPVIGYGMAWIGHFFFEKNKPATFKHPIYSLRGDFRMWWETMTARRKF